MKNKILKNLLRNLLKNLSLISLLFVISISVSCKSKRKVIDDDFAVDSASASLPLDGAGVDEFSDFDAPSADAPTNEVASTDATSNIEKELNEISDTPKVIEPTVVAEVTPQVAPEVAPVEIPATEVVSSPVPVVNDVQNSATSSKISNVQYKGNSNGGTIIISSNIPLVYTTRINSSANQVIIEVENTTVPQQFKRPLNTKDMSSSIGHIDVYQKKDSKSARFVIQLRPNSPEPLVQPEGNSLLIIGSAIDGSGPNPKSSSVVTNEKINSSDPKNNEELNSEMTALGIMSSDDLEEFLTNNNKFYGKKISIETTDMDVRDILKFISEESGVNMVFDDDVSGKSSLKLRKVPWDQALVILLKSKKFGYRRQGSILRIAKIDNLIKEDENAVKLKESKAIIEPLVVKNFSINYADIDKLETKIKDFIAENKKENATRGRVTSDTRTNMLIVTETATKLDQIGQLIRALDTQPQQVMIEARIIEASDSYTLNIGGSIGSNRTAPGGISVAPGASIPNFSNGRIAVGGSGSSYESHGINITPSKGPASGSFVGNMFFGTLGAFGNLDAQLALDEIENRVKILSSPRVAVLTNTAATINQGVTILQPTSSTPSATGGPATQTFTPTKVGVSLKVTPQVSNIGTVRLQLDVSRTSLSAAGSSDIDDRSVKTEVIVKSGDTAVIGGVFQSDVNKSKSGVPGLKDIPILGTLFKGQSEINSKVELMIFVTPKIIPLLNQVFKADAETPAGQKQ